MWFITAGGATFAAWPLVYAAAFSGFYVALILTLFALFFRPVGFDYRSKVPDPRWRNAWDWGIFVGGTVPALVFGVAFGNLLQGVPFHFDAGPPRSLHRLVLRPPQSVRAARGRRERRRCWPCTARSTCSSAPKGAVQRRAAAARRIAGAVFIVAFAGAGVWLATGIEGYAITAMPPRELAVHAAREDGRARTR